METTTTPGAGTTSQSEESAEGAQQAMPKLKPWAPQSKAQETIIKRVTEAVVDDINYGERLEAETTERVRRRIARNAQKARRTLARDARLSAGKSANPASPIVAALAAVTGAIYLLGLAKRSGTAATAALNKVTMQAHGHPVN